MLSWARTLPSLILTSARGGYCHPQTGLKKLRGAGEQLAQGHVELR